MLTFKKLSLENSTATTNQLQVKPKKEIITWGILTDNIKRNHEDDKWLLKQLQTMQTVLLQRKQTTPYIKKTIDYFSLPRTNIKRRCLGNPYITIIILSSCSHRPPSSPKLPSALTCLKIGACPSHVSDTALKKKIDNESCFHFRSDLDISLY